MWTVQESGNKYLVRQIGTDTVVSRWNTEPQARAEVERLKRLAGFKQKLTSTQIEVTGISPSTSVESETSFGQGASSGTSLTYSRGDHTHGTPADPSSSIPDPSDSVSAETSFGISSAAGSSDDYSRADHTHGTPADPVTTHESTYNHSSYDTHIGAASPHSGHEVTSAKGAANGYASLNASQLVVENPANATATPTASKIPIADGSGKLDGWVSDADGSTKGLVKLANHLGGTAALPTVIGCTETGGPTSLLFAGVGDGEYLKRSGSTIVGDTPAAGGSPGGSDTHVQYNDGGSFGGEANFAYDDTKKRLTLYDSSYNTKIGYNVANSGSFSASHTTLLGYEAGTAITSGGYHTLIGYRAGKTLTTGAADVAIGSYALMSTNGGSNTAIGYCAAWNATSGTYNTAIGTSALNTMTTSQMCTAIGASAGYNITTGQFNLCAGYASGSGLSTNSYCVAIGHQAIQSKNGSGVPPDAITAVGRAAFQAGGLVGFSAALGYNAGATQRTGSSCTYIGAGAAQSNTTSSYNTMIGAYAGWLHAPTSGNITSVADAGGGYITITSASHGRSNGEQLTIAGTADYNGTYTISNVTANTFDVADTYVSTQTGTWTLTSTSYGGHTMIGASSGGQITTGYRDTYIGSYAGYYHQGACNNNICIGYYAGPSTNTTESDKLYIHNAAGTPTIYGDLTNKYVGLGLTDPASRLDLGAGALTVSPMSAPSTPSNDHGVLYLVTDGGSPATLTLKIKWPDGTTDDIASGSNV